MLRVNVFRVRLLWNTLQYSEMHPDISNKKRPIEGGERDKQGDRAVQEGLPARKKKRMHRGTRSGKAKLKGSRITLIVEAQSGPKGYC